MKKYSFLWLIILSTLLCLPQAQARSISKDLQILELLFSKRIEAGNIYNCGWGSFLTSLGNVAVAFHTGFAIPAIAIGCAGFYSQKSNIIGRDRVHRAQRFLDTAEGIYQSHQNQEVSGEDYSKIILSGESPDNLPEGFIEAVREGFDPRENVSSNDAEDARRFIPRINFIHDINQNGMEPFFSNEIREISDGASSMKYLEMIKDHIYKQKFKISPNQQHLLELYN